ncbi:MAG: bifunctional diguanylate cyclase/phosphodiesterase [Acidimicrobiales bacterium]
MSPTMAAAPTDERRTQSLAWGRALPWIVAGSIAIASVAVFLVRRSSVQAERDRAISSAEALFANVVKDTESRIGLEQSKLLFLAKGAAAWASSAGANDTTSLARYMQNLPVVDRVPALRWVALADLADGSVTVSAAASGSGEPLLEMEGVDLGADARVIEAIADAPSGDLCSVSVLGPAGEEQVVLITTLPENPGRVVVLGFVGPVFLSPALAHEGVDSALVPPDGEFLVTRSDGGLPDFRSTADGVISLSSDESVFRYSAQQDIFGSEWVLVMSSGQDFLDIPGSSEHWVILAAGLTLALAVLGLLTTRQRASDRRAKVAAELSRSNRRYLTGFERAPIGSAEITVDGTIVRSNRTMARQLGRADQDIEGSRLFDFVHPADAQDQADRFAGMVEGNDHTSQAEVRYLRPDGHVVWITESISSLDRADDTDRRFLVQSLDTTARRVAELELEHMAFNDALTGLPNRVRLLEHLGLVLEQSSLDASPVSLFFIDIDRFKVVNDSLGHSAGDEVIATVGRRLADLVEAPHFIARFGGDEFAVVCSGVDDGEALDRFADALLADVRQPIAVGGDVIHVTASIGVIVGSGRDDSPESMLRDADAAMYRAKAAGRNTVERFEFSMRAEAVRRLDLERSLRKAIERDEFTIHYQPVIDLSTNRIAGFEALLRWHHPELGLLEPSQFLQIADEAGLMDEIDEVTLQRACAQLNDWSQRSEAAKSWHLAVNCSPKWFHDSRLRELIPAVLGSSSLEANRLWLEVTENDLLSDSDAAMATFSDLHDLGVNVAIDDFGTGFSSLSYLSQFHVDRLKIDRSFVQSLDRSDADEAIVAAVVEMASALGIGTVAEGAESEAQLAALRRLGADYVQGYLLSRPLAPDEVERALAEID